MSLKNYKFPAVLITDSFYRPQLKSAPQIRTIIDGPYYWLSGRYKKVDQFLIFLGQKAQLLWEI